MHYSAVLLLGLVFSGCGAPAATQAVQAASPAAAPTYTLALPTLTPTPLPATAMPTPAPTETPRPTLTPAAAPFYDQFVAAIKNDNPAQVVGVYVEGVLALRVVQQPANNPGFVSGVKGIVTYFSMVRRQTGNNGLLAHNYLAGAYYYDLVPGQEVVLIYGDGHTEEYAVSASHQFQALNPTSPSSDFVNVETGERLSSTSLFQKVYGGNPKTTFQTCIAQGNDPSWGRLFVIAPRD